MKKPLLCLLPTVALIVACSPQPTQPASRSAQFSSYPAELFETFEVSCEGANEQFSRPEKTSYECRSTLPPDTSAFLILNYDGYPQHLPQGVRRMSSTRNKSGYRVDAELYFLVPQKDGATVKVPVESAKLDDELTHLYRYFGGIPI